MHRLRACIYINFRIVCSFVQFARFVPDDHAWTRATESRASSPPSFPNPRIISRSPPIVPLCIVIRRRKTRTTNRNKGRYPLPSPLNNGRRCDHVTPERTRSVYVYIYIVFFFFFSSLFVCNNDDEQVGTKYRGCEREKKKKKKRNDNAHVEGFCKLLMTTIVYVNL